MKKQEYRSMALPVAFIMGVAAMAASERDARAGSVSEDRYVSVLEMAQEAVQHGRLDFVVAQGGDSTLNQGDRADIFDRPAFNQIVTLKAKDAQFQNILRLIAEKTDLNILLDPDEIDGNRLITFNLRNVPLGHALDNILRTHKLAYIIEAGDIIRIVPESRVGREEVETVTEIIELNWRDVKDVQKTFQSFLSSHGTMNVNEEAQAIIITDVPPNVSKLRELITQIDQPERQVVIEARLVDVVQNAGRTLGVQWDMAKVNKFENRNLRTVGGLAGEQTDLDPETGEEIRTLPTNTFYPGDMLGHPGVVNEVVNGIIGEGSALPVNVNILRAVTEGVAFNGSGGALAFGDVIGILGDDYSVDALLNASEQQGLVEILANPRVTTLNNVKATIEIVQRIPYRQGDIGSGGIAVIRIEFEDTGVKIDVLPIITPDGHVRLQIRLEQEIFRGRVGQDPLGLAPPLIDERSTLSTVIVLDQHTVVLGGLRGLERNESVEGIPWLHKMPVLGWLFKTKNYGQAKTDLVLMTTPHIVEEALLNDTEREMYDRLDVNWHLPDWYFDDVHTVYDK